MQLVRPAPGKCGNGILDAGEQCEPPGSSNPVQFACPSHQTAYETCNNACQYEAPVCRADANCGNGRIDGGEQCDDGNLNGSYGHCSRTCSPAGPQNDAAHLNAGFCGDGIRNYNDKNHNGVQNDGEGFVEYCDKADAKFLGFGYCSKKPSQFCGVTTWGGGSHDCTPDEGICLSLPDASYNIVSPSIFEGVEVFPSCAANCQSAGGYCGDGILQISDEECDDSNKTNLDGCNQYCRTENISCISATPARDIQEQGPDTFISITYNNSVSDQCINTDGDHICAGMGLPCSDVKVKRAHWVLDPVECNVGLDGQVDQACLLQVPPRHQEFRFETFGLNACQEPLNKNIATDVQIQCAGHKAGFVAAAVAGSCGNSIVDPGEACDTGAANGQICDPEYERSCSYCSGDCKKVLTRDPADICGNGKIDIDGRLPLVNGAPQPEACDIMPRSNQVLTPGPVGLPAAHVDWGNDDYRNWFNARQTAPLCPDKGVYTCENNCRTLVSTCINCNDYRDNVGKPIPKIGILNVMTPRDINDVGQADNINTDWGRATARHFIRLNSTENPSGLKNFDGSAGWASDNDLIKEDATKAQGAPDRWRQYLQAYNTSDYNEMWWAISSRDNFPLDRGYEYKTSAREAGPWSAATIETVRGIETNLLCKDEYALYFNAPNITQNLGGAALDIGPTLYAAGAKASYERLGSFFPYPVNGELREVRNEMILSPAVPAGTFRVVVKWKHFVDGPDVAFAPVVYNRDLIDASGQYRTAMVDLLRAKSETNRLQVRADDFVHNFLCSQMELSQGYWMPFHCASFKDPDAAGNNDGSIFVHTPGTLKTISAEASTIVTADYRGAAEDGHFNSPYAVFVELISGTSTVPITSFANLDVTVEVYEYHEGQLPQYSLYLPNSEHIYSLQSATQSSNAGIAKYWHVFNLEKNNRTHQYELKQIVEAGLATQYPQGAIATSFADVLCRVPGEACRRE